MKLSRALALLLIAGCSDDGPPTRQPVVDSIVITASTTSMQVGQTQRLTATARDASGNALSNATVTWSSSAIAVAGVDGSGEVTANSPGQTLVKASAGGRADSVTITVQATPGTSPILPILGRGAVTERYTAEVNVTASGAFAYTSTWNILGSNVGNAVKVWNVSGATPVLVDSVIVTGATTLGDLQVSDDGALLVVATERANGSIVILSLANPAKPVQISRFTSPSTTNGVHTAEVARVNGRLYAFLSVDPGSGAPARLTIVDINDPANPVQVFSQEMGNPFVHDVFVRDGLLFTALWNDGLKIWDIGGTHGGSPSNPVALGTVLTVGGEAHNVLWFHDPADGSRRYAFVGEEGPGVVGSRSDGDIHVVDVTDPAAPREVAFYHVPGAGTHNFSADEASGVLYAAFYNAGVRALDVRGDLGSCTAAQRSIDGRCDLSLMGRELARGLVNNSPMPVYIWGVQHVGTRLFASDMLNGLWVLDASALARSN